MGVRTLVMANEIARALRRNRTRAEQVLWKQLRDLKRHGWKFRQQVPIDRYIVDFACLSQRLIIEVDGATHSTNEELERDRMREAFLIEQEFRVLRFWNRDVFDNMRGVLDSIVAALESPTPNPSPQGGGEKNSSTVDAMQT